MQEIQQLVEQLSVLLLEKKWRVITAESCTGGGIVDALTSIAGSSQWCEGGFVTYSNKMKQRILGVKERTITEYGAVSYQVVEAMALGALVCSEANVSTSVSGIAGPEGGSLLKPVGTVWFGWSLQQKKCFTHHACFQGNRHEIRQQSVYTALLGLYSLCNNGKLCFNNN